MLANSGQNICITPILSGPRLLNFFMLTFKIVSQNPTILGLTYQSVCAIFTFHVPELQQLWPYGENTEFE